MGSCARGTHKPFLLCQGFAEQVLGEFARPRTLRGRAWALPIFPIPGELNFGSSVVFPVLDSETNEILLNFTVSHLYFLPLSMITLQIKRLRKSFGTKNIIRDLSFEYSGDPLGIAGANGSGKSTLLKCMGGLLSPTRGDVVWADGSETLSKEQLRQRMGYAAPYINLYDELSCLENLHFLSSVRSRQNEATYPVEEWIRKTGLREVSAQPYGKLSTGQQQRLRLAAALFHQPDILLLDEPGSNLDKAGKSLVTDIAESFQNTPARLLIIASNNPEELDLCGRVFSVENHTFV